MNTKHLNIKFWLGVFFLGLLVFTIYSPAINGEWLWDDDDLVSHNLVLRTAGGLKDIWLNPRSTQQYYPLTFTVFWMQYQAWGLATAGYHLINILLHVLNAILVWQVFRRLNVKGAFAVAAIFAVHPVCVETVAWISELKNLLSGLFYLLALLFYLHYDDVSADGQQTQAKQRWFVLSLLCFTLALLSKTTAATLAPVLVLLSWWKGKRPLKQILKNVIPFFLLGILAGGVTLWCEKVFVGARGEFWQYTVWERLMIAGRALWFYPSKIVWPARLSFFYELWPVQISGLKSYLPVLSFAVVLTALFFLRKRLGRGPFTAVAFYAVTIFPALGFFDIETMRYSFVADHYQYFASLGWISLIVAGGYRLLARRIQSRLFFAGMTALVLIAGALAVCSYHQSRIYQSRFALYKDVLEKNPGSWMAYNNLGCLYSQQGRYPEAVASFSKTLQIDPESYLAYYNRAIANLNLQRYDAAVSDATSAVMIKPSAQAFELRGFIYFQQGLLKKALREYDLCLRLDPDFSAGLALRGEIYAALGLNDSALNDLSRLLVKNPEYCRAYQLRASIYQAQKESGKVETEKQRARQFGCGWDDL